MGNQQYQASRSQSSQSSSYDQWSSPRFEQYSGISSSRLGDINQEFRRAAGSDGLISPNEFHRIYKELNLGSNDRQSIDRAFQAFDRDRSGKLSFDEFLSATVMLNNNTNAQQRVSYLIDSNNPNGMNHTYITPEYGRAIINNMNQFYDTDADFDDIWPRLNVNNGQVAREEFVTYLREQPSFSRHLYA
jgi:Ca2+-binding EF-hand superfamily protein